MSKKLFVLVLALVLVSLAAFSAVKNPDTLIVAQYGSPESLDPQAMWDTASGEVVSTLYENLIRYDGESIDMIPMISTAVPTMENGLLTPDGKVYTFPIRKGVLFHSGNTLTPADVEYTFERGFLGDNSSGAMTLIIEAVSGGQYFSIESWFEDWAGMAYSDAVIDREPVSEEARAKLIEFYEEVIDPLFVVEGDNFVVNMKGSFGPFLYTICYYAGWAGILDAEWMKVNGAWDGKADGWWKWHDLQPEESPIHMDADAGSGPFKLQVWDQENKTVVLQRFDQYWQGPAKLKSVILRDIEEFSTRKALLEAGDVDLIAVDPIYRGTFDNTPGVTVIEGFPRAQVTSIHFTWAVDPASEYIGSGQFDGEGIPYNFFDDINTRKAILHSFNYDALIEDLVNGLGERVPTDLPKGFFGYDPNLPMYEFDLGMAEQAWKAAWDGQAWENGFKLVAMYNSGNEVRQTCCEMIKVYTESMNPKFKVDVIGAQWPTYLKATRERLCPLYIIGWVADYPDAHNFLSTYYHSEGYYGQRHGGSYTALAEAQFNELIEKGVREPNPVKRLEYYDLLQRRLLENYVSTPLYMPQGLWVGRSWVQGYFPHILRSNGDTTPEYYYAWKAE
ncbi:MAG TPA: ABC transporter substrate-binding protein [Thermotogota bacterium]|nr:ABC transporter substrate-binding protein [Thermotogota bacterium]HRW92292.1 ABC transporter substrate-binding protein [Thermotogota bacterium]